MVTFCNTWQQLATAGHVDTYLLDSVVDAVGPLLGRHALPEEHRDQDDGREHHQVHVEALADVEEAKLEEGHGDEGFGDALREAVVHHGVEEEEEVHHGLRW